MTRVLIVDDEPQILRALSITLKARSYDVVIAVNGRQALAAAAESAPDIVVLDLGLPDLDGVDVIRGPAGLDQRADHRVVRSQPWTVEGRRPRRRR